MGLELEWRLNQAVKSLMQDALKAEYVYQRKEGTRALVYKSR